MGTIVFVTLIAGTALGLILGVPIGRWVERIAWHTDNAMIHARFAGTMVRNIANKAALGVLLLALAVAFIVWA